MTIEMKMIFSFVCALFGDYVLQSDYMAQCKTKNSWPALCHVVVYTLCFLPITQDWRALLFIAGTHFVIDRFRLARYVCWAKNMLAPRTTETWTHGPLDAVVWRHPWSECSGTGYHKDRPPWMSVWLIIIADNAMHFACNLFALWRWQ